jgi:WD40 repeat protein
MVPLPQRSSIKRAHKHKRFPWLLGMIMSLGIIAILAFIIVTLLILQSQGISQGMNILTIISIVVGFAISVLSLLISFLQWHHSQLGNQPEPPLVLPLQVSDSASPDLPPSPSSLTASHQQDVTSNTNLLLSPAKIHRSIDWGEAPDSEQLYGREKELVDLKRWLLDEHCRLVAILGMGGIGKTSLAATLVSSVHEHYDCVFWRSLHNAPPLSNVLQEYLQFVSAQADTVPPAEVDRQISRLIDSFRTRRCLLVLDNVESILQGGSQAGHYREGYEGYGRLLQRIGESKHQSCLLVTSREKPPEVALLEGENATTRSLHLEGLSPEDGQDILKDKGLQGTEYDWEVLITRYGGNPLALKLVAQMIREVFGSTIAAFLKDGELFFRDARDVLEQQIKRLSALEEEIVYWLATEREAIALTDLQERIVHPVSKGDLQEALRSLRRRQLIETRVAGFTLHHVIMEYLTERFVERVCEEIRTERLVFFERHALLLAQAKDYIRESQSRLILQPLLQRLLTTFSKEALEQRFQDLLTILRTQHDQQSGYAAGNILNLLIQMGGPLQGYDFSRLVVWQAYLQGVDLPDVNFAQADLAKSVFTDTFGGILCVAWSREGGLLAAGTVTGEIRLWSASGLPLQTIQGHTDWVYSVAFSPDGKTLVSGGDDQVVCLWEVSSGKCLNMFHGHTRGVYSVAFSPDGKILASGGNDQAVRLWDVSSGKLLHTLQGSANAVWSVVFSPDGKILASGSDDRTVCLWEVSSGKLLQTLSGHRHWVRSVAFSPDGRTLASGSFDQTIRLWEVSSGTLLHTLRDHASTVWSVAFNPDGKILASGSDDKTVRLWEISSGKLLQTLSGHSRWVRSVAFSPDGRTLASGSYDQTVSLWEVSSGKLLYTLHGYNNVVFSVAFSPDGKTLASGSYDQTIRLWQVGSGKLLTSLHGPTNIVWSVAFSPDGRTLASGSFDPAIRLWEVSTGKLLTTLYRHSNWVYSVAFSPDGKILASGSGDQTVRLWEVGSGKLLTILHGHANVIWSVAFSPDGRTLVSGSEDQTVRLWEVSSGKLLSTLYGHGRWVLSVIFSPDGRILASGSDDQICLWEVSSGKLLSTLHGHSNWVWSVAFSPDGRTLASSSADQTVRLWEVSSGELLTTLHGHSHWVPSVAFSPDGKVLASCDYDGVIMLWDCQTGTCLRILRSDRPYERMNITQVKGLTEAQKATLRLLGAIEDEEQERV